MSNSEFVGYQLTSHAVLADSYGHYIVDEALARCAAKAMEHKLAVSRDKGRGGWWHDECSIESLEVMLVEHIKKGDMVDVMNIAAMIWGKQEMARFKSQ